MSPGKRANFNDIAELAGVSPSTVDRVLNERGSASDAKRRLVLEAARQVGVKRRVLHIVGARLARDISSPSAVVNVVAETYRAQGALLQAVGSSG